MVQWSEEGEGWMRNLPCLPRGKRQGSEKRCCHTTGKHCAWWAGASKLLAPAGHTIRPARGTPQRRRLYLAISQGCWSVSLWWLSQLFTAGITKAASARSLLRMALYKLCTLAQQANSAMRHLAAKQHTANRCNEHNGRGGEKDKQEGERNTRVFCVTKPSTSARS